MTVRSPLGRGEMTEVQPVLDFASSGRSGRRNALPDILGSPAGVSPSDLPLKLTELSLTVGSCRMMEERRLVGGNLQMGQEEFSHQRQRRPVCLQRALRERTNPKHLPVSTPEALQ
ncbi:hypothetical protein AMELA_G00171870 [Ameiurus melas]|uniref:Uncharacterized protein n=1 Tax=Ameiurus melas TaxID=219545 RepID=A0A7J6ACF3_AMEME|nr:hypothetical protein AMELA_G00171870 [Ameiurus melas]